MSVALPELHGLVLTGGASSRMGRDKAEIAYGPLPQWRAVAELLAPLCTRTWWSCTARQREAWDIGEAGIVDQQPGLGPAGGLHAAFTRHSDVAWLVVGCDYPHLTARDCRDLAEARSLEAQAVAFADATGTGIEPTLSVWEPAAQRAFLRAFEAGERSPRAVLRSVALRIVTPANIRAPIDRNTPGVA
jgi:molybdenum cofactor guanylyltransferase